MQGRARTTRKTYNLPQELIGRVKRIYGSRTETEAIIRCMEDASFMHEVASAARRTAGRLPRFDPYR